MKKEATCLSGLAARAASRVWAKRSRSASAPARVTYTASPFTANLALESSPAAGGRTRAHVSARAAGPSLTSSAQRASLAAEDSAGKRSMTAETRAFSPVVSEPAAGWAAA